MSKPCSIFQRVDLIPPSFINGRKMNKFGVVISFSEPVDSGFKYLELLFLKEGFTKFLGEGPF